MRKITFKICGLIKDAAEHSMFLRKRKRNRSSLNVKISVYSFNSQWKQVIKKYISLVIPPTRLCCSILKVKSLFTIILLIAESSFTILSVSSAFEKSASLLNQWSVMICVCNPDFDVSKIFMSFFLIREWRIFIFRHSKVSLSLQSP